MSAPPCYERHPCPDRRPGCHAHCDAYLAWQKRHNEEKDRVYEEKARQRMLDGIGYRTGKERRKPK